MQVRAETIDEVVAVEATGIPLIPYKRKCIMPYPVKIWMIIRIVLGRTSLLWKGDLLQKPYLVMRQQTVAPFDNSSAASEPPALSFLSFEILPIAVTTTSSVLVSANFTLEVATFLDSYRLEITNLPFAGTSSSVSLYDRW